MSAKYPPMEHWELEEQVIPSTAGNVDYLLTPGAGFRWIIMSGWIQFVADGNAADRVFQMFHENDTPARIGLTATVSAAITAGQTKEIAFNEGYAEVKTADQTELVVFTTGFLMIEGTQRLRISFAAGVAGDAYTGRVIVLKLKL